MGLAAGCAGLGTAVAMSASGGGAKLSEKSPNSSGSGGSPTESKLGHNTASVIELTCMLPAQLMPCWAAEQELSWRAEGQNIFFSKTILLPLVIP